MKLDLGCGGRGTKYDGFVGVDVHPLKDPHHPKARYVKMDITHDPLMKEVFPDGCADEIICLHVIEHMDRREGIELMRVILRLLKDGARAYITTPNIELFIDKYMQRDTTFFRRTYHKTGKEMWPGRTMLDRLFRAMKDENEHGHRYPYDMETLVDAAQQAGAVNIRAMFTDHKWSTRPDHEIGLIVEKS